MGCHIAHDRDQNLAVLYCTTSEWAFGPVFTDNTDHDADARAEAFLRWLRATDAWSTFEKEPIQSNRREARDLTDVGLAAAYATWLMQEADQWAREERAVYADDEE